MIQRLTALCFIIATLSAALPLFADDQSADRPNFLVILCDDLGYGDLACYGNPTIRTPHLDKLASQGIRFTDCYASAPVCSSSRAGLLTGRTPNRVGVYDWIPAGHQMHLKRDEVTIATILRDAGYATCHVGKWHLNGHFNSPKHPQPSDHGFEYWFGTQNNAAPTHENPRNFVRNGKPTGEIEGYSCQIVAEEAIDWLQSKRDKAKPFFLFVCFHEPHEPCASPTDMVDQYKQAGADKRGEAIYYANVENMDAAVGKLMGALDQMKLADNTLVFFTSDNGPETLNRYRSAWRSHGSPGPLRGMKLHIYDGGIRVPGILRWPDKVKAEQELGEPIAGQDLLPTLCKLANAPLPDGRVLDGSDISPLLHGQPVTRQTPLFWAYYRALSPPRVAMRQGDWKIVAHWDGPTDTRTLGGNINPRSQAVIKSARLVKFELYNVRKDIAEKVDLAASEPDRLAAMKAAIITKYTDVQEQGPVWE